jgi:HD-GYP domain-containing protein (c-di-GMP phosphodiesterase class II)
VKENLDATLRLNTLGGRLVGDVFQLARNARVHHESNAVFPPMAAQIARLIGEVFASEQQVALRFVHDTVFLNDLRLKLDASLFGCCRYLSSELAARGLGGLGFVVVVDADAAVLRSELYRVFAGLPRPVREEARPFTAIVPLPPAAEAEQLLRDASTDLETAALQAYGKAIYFVRVFFQGVKRNKPPKVGVARRIVSDLIDVSERDAGRFMNLACIKDHEALLQTHSVNTCILAIGLGQGIGLSRAALAELALCALFHELGRVFLPDELVATDHPLSGHERALLETQPLHAARALLSSSGGSASAFTRISVAYEYGTPFRDHVAARSRGAPGLSLFSRIVSVCHSFDELTRFSAGRPPLLPDEALASLVASSGTLFDPVLVKLFVNMLGLYPVGTPVALDTGEQAIVFYAPVDPRFLDRPVVKVVRDRAGAPCKERVVDLSKADEQGRYPATIVRSLAASLLPAESFAAIF